MRRKRRPNGAGSIIKRGNVYYLYHTKYGKLKGESLGTGSRMEAGRLARKRLDELDMEIALTHTTQMVAQAMDQEEQEYEEERRRQAYLDDMAIREEDKLLDKQDEQEVQRKRIYKNPKLDEFWRLGKTREEDTGLFPEWCKAGHRSPNTVIAYRTAWKKFRKNVQPPPERLRDITRTSVEQFNQQCKKQGVSDAAIRQYLIGLQGMLSTAINEEWYQGENPFRYPWKAKRDTVAKYLSKEEVERLLEAAREVERNTYLFIAIAVHTGMRKDEVANLRWEDIQFERKNPKTGEAEPVVVLQARKADPTKGIQEFRLKNNAARIIPLKTELVAILQSYREEAGYIIQSVSGSREIKRTRYCLPMQFGEAARIAGVHCNPHMLRHTFASHAAIAGESIYKISRWLGHSTVQITADTYAHLQDYDPGINNF